MKPRREPKSSTAIPEAIFLRNLFITWLVLGSQCCGNFLFSA
jgi:hypothetical protein